MRWLPESIFGGNPAPGDVLWPEERCTIEQMIQSFTMGPAYANFLENVTGSLEVGKSADLVVVDTDLTSIPPEEIGGVSVLMTMFRGERVFGDL
jgi:predicted amidohydrolase YtcJ